jgi:hypothetical protein
VLSGSAVGFSLGLVGGGALTRLFAGIIFAMAAYMMYRSAALLAR